MTAEPASPATNYGQDQLDRGLGQQEYDAANAFTGDYNNALTGYAGVLGQNSQNMVGAIQGAESNVQSNPAYKPVAPTTANYDATNSAQYGTAIYKGADGTLYTSDGNVFTPPQAKSGAYYDAGFGSGYVPAGGF